MRPVCNPQLDRGGTGWYRLYADRPENDHADVDSVLSSGNCAGGCGDHTDGSGAGKVSGILPAGIGYCGRNVHDKYGRFRKCCGIKQCTPNGAFTVRADRDQILRSFDADAGRHSGAACWIKIECKNKKAGFPKHSESGAREPAFYTRNTGMIDFKY